MRIISIPRLYLLAIQRVYAKIDPRMNISLNRIITVKSLSEGIGLASPNGMRASF
jgi:hypothetical protein